MAGKARNRCCCGLFSPTTGATLVTVFDLLLGTAVLSLVALDSATLRLLSPAAAGGATALALATVTVACAVAFGLWKENTACLVAAAVFYALQVAGVLLAATGAAVFVIVARPQRASTVDVDGQADVQREAGGLLLTAASPYWLVPAAAFGVILYSGASVWRLLAVLAARRHIADEYRATAERCGAYGGGGGPGGVPYFVPASASGYCTPAAAAAYADYCSMPYSRPASSSSMHSRYTMQPNMNMAGAGMANYAYQAAPGYGYYISPYPNVGRVRHSYA